MVKSGVNRKIKPDICENNEVLYTLWPIQIEHDEGIVIFPKSDKNKRNKRKLNNFLLPMLSILTDPLRSTVVVCFIMTSLNCKTNLTLSKCLY